MESERAWQALGEAAYGPTDADRNSLVFRRSIYVAEDIAEGDLFTSQNLGFVAPSDGVPSSLLKDLLGRPARRPYKRSNSFEP